MIAAERHKSALIPAMIALMQSMGNGAPQLPVLPAPRPRGYGIHLTKTQRRGKTWQEQQAMREAIEVEG